MKSNNNFKDSLSVPIFETYCKSIFNLLRSKTYENYTDVVLSTFGKELENYFSPSDFRLKYRYKSEKSFYNNISKDSLNKNFTSNFNKYITYDIIGMRLVIENIPDKFSITEEFKARSKSDLQELKKKLYFLQTKLYNSKDSSLNNELDNQIEFINSKIIYLTNCVNFDSLLAKRNSIQKDIHLINKKLKNSTNCSLETERKNAFSLLENLNNMLGLIAGNFAIEDIFKNSENIHKLGVSLDSSRQKYFNDSTGYNSIHFCLKSSLYPSWVSELQDRSSFMEYISKYGPTIHDKIPGKKRKLCPLPYITNSNDIHRYIYNLNYILPSYTKYITNGYIKKYTKKENVQHYYKKLFLENTEYSLKANTILLDKPTMTYLPTLKKTYQKKLVNAKDSYTK